MSGFLVGPHEITYSGNVSVTVGGKTAATSYAGSAYGIYVRTAYEATVHAGDVVAYSHNSEATGVHVVGDSYIETGNVTAMSFAGNARAVYGFSTGYLGVQVNGTAYAMSTDGHAIGVYMSSDGDSHLVVTGDVGARSIDSYATGVGIYTDGNSTGTISGNVSARAEGTATGVRDYSGNVNLTVTGEVVAVSTEGNATGLIASGDTVHASIGGAYAYSVNGAAYGVNAHGRYVHANSTGDVFAESIDSTAIGVRTDAYNSAFIHVVGNVTAKSTDAGSAFGVEAPLLGAVTAYVSVSGEVVAQSTGGDATGAYAAGGDGLGQVVVGSAYAYSEDLRAPRHRRLDVYSLGRGEADSVGDVRARSYDGTAVAVEITARKPGRLTRVRARTPR